MHTKGNNATRGISIEIELLKRAIARQNRLGLKSFSAYIQHLIMEDVIAGGSMTLQEHADYRATPSQNKRQKQ